MLLKFVHGRRSKKANENIQQRVSQPFYFKKIGNKGEIIIIMISPLLPILLTLIISLVIYCICVSGVAAYIQYLCHIDRLQKRAFRFRCIQQLITIHQVVKERDYSTCIMGNCWHSLDDLRSRSHPFQVPRIDFKSGVSIITELASRFEQSNGLQLFVRFFQRALGACSALAVSYYCEDPRSFKSICLKCNSARPLSCPITCCIYVAVVFLLSLCFLIFLAPLSSSVLLL